ncbi:MAG: hypothetical protein V4692_14860, partial [Bdellovibrionota bacterium]
LPWKDRENSYVTEDDQASWGPVLSSAISDDALDRSVRSKLAEFARLETFDFPSNVMSRIYAQLIAKRNR